MRMDKSVIIVAGGKGMRMGRETPKQFLEVKGKPVLMRTIDAFALYDSSLKIIVVLPEDQREYWNKLCERHTFARPHTVVAGGITRFHSVKNGLRHVAQGLVAVHDGVRPFVASDVIGRCFEVAELFGAAVPVIPLVDTIRHREGGVSHTVNRDDFCLVQTPQTFDTSLLKEAYGQEYNPHFTDDASVVESLGKQVALVEGSRKNIKLTTPFDLRLAEILAE